MCQDRFVTFAPTVVLFGRPSCLMCSFPEKVRLIGMVESMGSTQTFRRVETNVSSNERPRTTTRPQLTILLVTLPRSLLKTVWGRRGFVGKVGRVGS